MSTFQDDMSALYYKYPVDSDEEIEHFVYAFFELMNRYGKSSINDIVDFLIEKEHHGTSADILETLGHISIPAYAEERRQILTACLYKSRPSSWLRDGAVRGLSYLDDPRTLGALEVALGNEPEGRMRNYLTRVIKQIRDQSMEHSIYRIVDSQSKPLPGHRYTMGLNFSPDNVDYCVIDISEENIVETGSIHYYKEPVHILSNRWNLETIWVIPNSFYTLIDELSYAGLPVRTYNYAPSQNNRLVYDLLGAVHSGQLGIPLDRQLINEFDNIQPIPKGHSLMFNSTIPCIQAIALAWQGTKSAIRLEFA